jgi:hypothetical protein
MGEATNSPASGVQMTYGPPPEPNAYPGPPQPHPQQPGPNHPQQAAPNYPQQAAPNYPHQAGPSYPQAAGPNHPQQAGSSDPQAAGPNHRQQPGPDYPQHLWPDHAQRPAPGGSPAVEPPKGSGLLAVASLILGLAGLVAPFLPMNMDGFRQYAAFPFALPGLVLAIAGLAGRRRAQPVAAIGALVSVFALAIGAYMVLAYNFNLF